MPLVFRTPTRQTQGPRHTADARGAERALYQHFHRDGTPVAVLLTAGVLVEKQVPTVDEMRAADVVFMGGRENVVDEATALLLDEAGYGPFIEDVNTVLGYGSGGYGRGGYGQ